MSNSLNVTFLGTSSAQPSRTRNHSSLAFRFGRDVWLFDCGEGTQHQIQKSQVKMGRIQKIFITHTHGDHIFGLAPLLASCLNGAGGTTQSELDPRTQADLTVPPLEIYGPLGTRAYVRSSLKYTYTLLSSPYVVHELRFTSDPPTADLLPPMPSEAPEGRNILQDQDGVWRDIFRDSSLSVSAAPIHHSVPCLGYVVDELPVPGKMDPAKYLPDIKRTKSPMSIMSRLQQGESVQLSDGTVLQGPARRRGRKVVILGDTYDPSPIAPLAFEADLLIHEATNAHLRGIGPDTKDSDTFETVEERAKSRGHSTPQMAGAFAKRIGAGRLILNHFSARYPGDDDTNDESKVIMDGIRVLAEKEYGNSVTCARDLMTIDIPIPSDL